MFMKSKVWSGALFIVAFLGFIDSVYLTYNGPMFRLFEQVCTNNVCDDFALKIFGIHISVYGILYYSLLMLFSIYIARKVKFIIVPLLIVTFGLIFSVYFLFYQAFVIKGFCIFCLVSLMCTITYFVLIVILYIMVKYRGKFIYQ